MKRRTWVESAMGCESGMRNQSVRTSSIVTERLPSMRRRFLMCSGWGFMLWRCVNPKPPSSASTSEISAIDDPVCACHKCGAGAAQVSGKFSDLVTLCEAFDERFFKKLGRIDNSRIDERPGECGLDRTWTNAIYSNAQGAHLDCQATRHRNQSALGAGVGDKIGVAPRRIHGGDIHDRGVRRFRFSIRDCATELLRQKIRGALVDANHALEFCVR